MKNPLVAFKSSFEQAEDSEHESRSTEIIQSEKQKEKYEEK